MGPYRQRRMSMSCGRPLPFDEWLRKRHPVEHDIVSEDGFTLDSGKRGHTVTCSCGEIIHVSIDLEHPATAARNLAYDQWIMHKRDTSS